jgi:hypothetical protein
VTAVVTVDVNVLVRAVIGGNDEFYSRGRVQTSRSVGWPVG